MSSDLPVPYDRILITRAGETYLLPPGTVGTVLSGSAGTLNVQWDRTGVSRIPIRVKNYDWQIVGRLGCLRCGGVWGEDETCAVCCDLYGNPRLPPLAVGHMTIPYPSIDGKPASMIGRR